jgi:hypothetical protein
MNVNDICPNNCAGRGECRDDAGCLCEAGFITHDCSMAIKCKDDCNKHGTCLNSARCSCFNGWTGNTCLDIIPCPNNCTSIEHGSCQSDMTCKCSEGYSGIDCSEGHGSDGEDPFKALLNLQALEISEQQAEAAKEEYHCPENCSGNGLCNQAEKKCDCFEGYKGKDCGKKKKKKASRKNSTDVEEAKNNSSLNDTNWFITDDCDKACSKHGLCVNSECYCEEDYTYEDCSMSYDDYKKLGKRPKDLILTWCILIAIGFILIIAIKIFMRSRSGSQADYIKIE